MKLIGEVKEMYNDEKYRSVLPDIKSKKKKKEIADKKQVLSYLKSFPAVSSSPYIVKDIITGDKINIPLEFYTDGVFGWRSDTVYYFEKYNLELGKDFINYVLAKKK